MRGAMDFGIADDGERAGREQAAQIAIAAFADTAKPVLPPLEFCLARARSRPRSPCPDRNAFGSATLATRAVANAGPTPGISSSRRLASLDRCQAMIMRSNSSICAFNIRSWAPRAVTQARATSGNRLSFGSADDPEQLFDTIAPDRRDDAELRKKGADGVDHRGLLADEQVPGTVQ